MARCFVLAALGCQCERGTKMSTVCLWLDMWHCSHELDALHQCARPAQAGKQQPCVGGSFFPPSLRKQPGCGYGPCGPSGVCLGGVRHPQARGGAHFPLITFCSLSCGSEVPRRCCAAARVPEVTKQKGNKSR